MVFDSSPVSSVIRFAARPVGAAREIFKFLFFISSIIALSVVVFPVPGPPVKISIPCFVLLITASRCNSSSCTPTFLSVAAISAEVTDFTGSAARSISNSLPAMRLSAVQYFLSDIKDVPSTCVSHSVPLNTNSSQASDICAVSVSSIFADSGKSFSRGRQVCPFIRLCFKIWAIPQPSLGLKSAGISILRAIPSTLSNPIPTSFSHSI